MSLVFRKRTIFSGIIAASSISTLALANPTEGFTVTPSIGYYHFDNNRNTDNNTAYSLGLGYQFNSPWAVEFNYLNADSNKNGQDVGVNQYRLDGLYSLPEFTTTKLTPYLAAGVGSEVYSKASDSTHAFVNAGGGVKYAINNNLALRADFRLVKDVESNHLDNVSSVGVQYTFGHKSSSSDSAMTDAAYESTQPAATPMDTQTEQPAAATTQAATTQTQPATTEQTPMAAQDQSAVSADQQSSTQDQSAMNDDQPSTSQTQSAVTTDQAAAAQTAPATTSQAAQPAVPKVNLSIEFAKNSATVTQTSYPEISKLADYLQANPDTTVTIEGYTDNTGTKELNQKLSEQRANAVAAVLVNTFQVQQSRVTAVGYGEAKPLFPNDTAAHRQANRRVVAVILNPKS